MFKKRTLRAIGITVIFLSLFFAVKKICAYGFEGETISYTIKPLGGRAEYADLGVKELNGKKARLSTFKTELLGFADTEKIYSDPDTLLPFRVERRITWWFGKEDIIEEYDQREFKVTITKLKKNKQVGKQVLASDGPIYNAILVPFYTRFVPGLDVGWSFIFRIPQKFEVRLTSIEEIKAGDKKLIAYHFVSNPDRFEIWISKDDARIPLRIQGKGKFNYSLRLKEYKVKAGQ